MRPIPTNLPAFGLLLSLTLIGCTTVQNRRDLYFPQCVWGPYTQMLHRGIPAPASVQGTVKTTASSDGKSVVAPQ